MMMSAENLSNSLKQKKHTVADVLFYSLKKIYSFTIFFVITPFSFCSEMK